MIVNRVWQWHFGQAIAANPNNFGGTGKLPTHPELLDWLAATFMEGWSFKKLHGAYSPQRIINGLWLILLRKPWRSSTLTKRATQSLPRRLTAEELRDAMLVASGELNRARAVFRIRNQRQPCSRGTSWAQSVRRIRPIKPAQRNRRTLYAERIRTLADPMLEVLNKPGGCLL